jgi:hypothetical protein
MEIGREVAISYTISEDVAHRRSVMRGIDLGRGLVKRLARQRRFEPPLS